MEQSNASRACRTHIIRRNGDTQTMLPIITIDELIAALETLIDSGYVGDTRLVLTAREDAGSHIQLAVSDEDGLSVIPGATFSGIEEI